METTNLTNSFGLSELPHGSYEFGGKAFTTQELWIKIAEKINILIEHFNYLDKSVAAKDKATQLKLEYLLGEGLNESVSKELLKRVEDGTLGKLINGTLLVDINKKVDDTSSKVDITKELIETDYNSKFNSVNNHISNIETRLYKGITDYKLPEDKDFTESFRRYFADLKSGKKITLMINVPLCEISEQIIMPYGVFISIIGFGQGNIIRYVGEPNTNVFYCRYGDNGEIEGVTPSSIQGEIRNLRFETNVANVIMFKQLKGYTNNFAFKDCMFNNFKYAIWLEKAWWTNITGCDFVNGENGVMLFDANTSRIVNTFFRFMSGSGITYDSDLTYIKNGTAGINLAFVNFEQVDVGIRIKSSLYGGIMTGCYWECNKDRPAILMENGSSMSNFTFSGNFARADNISDLQNLRAVTFSGGHMPLRLPTTTVPTKEGLSKNIQSLMLINTDCDYYPILNKKIHEDEIYDLTFIKNQKAWQPLTSNYPFTVSREEITIPAGEEITVANGLANRTFRLLNFFADGIWKATVKVYKGAEVVYSKKTDIGEGSIIQPLYKEDFIGSSPQSFSIKIANDTTSPITLRNLTLSYLCNAYKS